MKWWPGILASRCEQASANSVSARETCAHECTIERRVEMPIQKVQTVEFARLALLGGIAR
jgi:hypothetical protein